jgi:hypothetical protein
LDDTVGDFCVFFACLKPSSLLELGLCDLELLESFCSSRASFRRCRAVFPATVWLLVIFCTWLTSDIVPSSGLGRLA